VTPNRQTSLGPYELISPIGAGGMGEVFRARDTRLNREVAIKVLPKDFATDPDRLRRFEQEAKILAALNHPNILTIHDAGVHEGTPYLVSELLEGNTLRDEMGRTALPLRKAVEYALQVAHGLAAAHSKGATHRDLKPENIFVSKDGRVKILDFGLAKLRDSTPAPNQPVDAQTTVEATEPGRVMGTPAYMSPEQVRGEAADHRSDIFAFGCVLYEMLSGTRAFLRGTPVASMNAVLSETPAALSTINPSLPTALESITERCLQKQPNERFQTANDLAFALQMLGGASPARPTPALGQRRLVTPQTIWVAGLLTVAFVGALLWQTKRTPSMAGREPGVARGALRNIEVYLPVQAKPGCPRQVSEAYLSPDSRKLVYTDGRGLWLKSLDQVGPPQLVSTNRKCASPFWSPDSATIAWFEEEKLLARGLSGGEARLIGSMDSPVSVSYGGGAWLRDDRILCDNADGPLFVFPTLGGKREIAIPLGPGESDFHKPVAIAGNSAILFPVHGEHIQTIAYWDPTRGRKDIYKTTTDPLRGEIFTVGFAPSGHLFYADLTGLWAVPFSLEKLAATGPPFRIKEDCRWITVADDGTLGLVISELELLQRRRLAWVSRAGKLLGPAGSPEPGLGEPQLSADETQILYSTTTGGLWLLDAARQSASRLATAEQHPGEPFWDATGKNIFYSRGYRPHTAVVSVPAEKQGPETTLAAGMLVDIARDANLLMLVSKEPEAQFSWLSLASTNRVPTPLRPGALPGGNLWMSMSAQPRLSPNGQALAFVSHEPGREGVYCVRFPECDRMVSVFRGGGYLPVWRPDGQELLFIGADGRSMMAASVAWEANGPKASEPQRLFDLPDAISVTLDSWSEYAVTRKGDRFLMLQRADEIDNQASLTPALYLVENWYEEFRDGKSRK